MIRPCDQCFGGGWVPVSGQSAEDGTDECDRCVEMPWIVSAPHFPEGTPLVGRMKPDPESVMRWNFTLSMPWSGSGIHNEDDDFGWVARPVRLEEAP
jgi:hypothetical protein